MTSRIQQWDAPDVRLVETTEGEVTLSIEGQQAMQAWERDLMWAGADHLCTFGTEFLEVGLGLGISALRIASNPAIQRHVVIERYARVIKLFRERHPNPPPTLKIVEADVFEHYHTVPPASLDGVFFDPFMPAEIEAQKALWDEFMPMVVKSLRPGGAFIPFFTTEPVLKWPFFEYFDRAIVTKHSFVAYKDTNYTTRLSGTAYLQCFVRV
jgi:spermidine synthase